uniref:Protein transport protein Sec24C n=1 Tax=Ditylenchus dipsaci TaxID=166011 RepID=A0A915ETP9_9BILA
MPQMGVQVPQMSGNMPQMPGNMPQMPGNMPQMPGNMPQMPGNMPQMPGNMPQMAGSMPPGPPMPPGYQQQQMQQQGFAQQKQRLDPNMMPSVVQVVEDDRSSRSGLFPTGYPNAELPPLVSTEFVAQDQGNSNPKFMRSSLYAVPQTQDMVKSSCLPLSLSITPFAALSSSEISPPVIDLGELGPVRCQRCKAYMCPFMEFIDGGRKFRCPFCRSSTPVEEGYFAHLDHTGRRTDIVHRPELYLGSFEFVATKQYCKNGVKPKEPAFIFMVDVSYNAIRNGIVELLCRNLVDLLRSLPRDYGMDKSAVKIGLATYDNVIHFYNLSQEEGFLVDFEQAESSLVNCLKEIANNFADTRITETMLGPNREDRKVLGSDKEKAVLSPGTEFYGKLGEDCVKFGCAVDLFLFPNSFIDVASLAPVCNLTGGSIYKYQYFDCARDGVRFLADLKHDISREIAFDVMMRVRTSTGIRPTGFYGSFLMQNTTDIEMSAMDADKAVQVEIKYDDKLDEKEPVIFQTAVLFTSVSGQRRLRIHNISLPVTQDFNQIYRLTDEDAIITHLFKAGEKLVRDKSPKDMRDDIVNTCAHILSTYREKCSETAPLGQLILPECLKLLPVHVNCVMKNDALNGGSELTVDDRSWMMNLVPAMTIQEVSAFLYPRVYAISGLSLDSNGFFFNCPVKFVPPLIICPMMKRILSRMEWLHNVFNVNSLAQLDAEKHELPERDNPSSRAVRHLLNTVNEGRSRHAKGPVIQAGLDALKNLDRAGKLFVFHTSLPTLQAPGQLKNREDRKVLGSDKEKAVLSPGTEFYGKLGEDCVKFGCAVDLFLFPNSFIDVASLAPVCNLTGGSIYKYQYFDCARDGVRFLADLKHDISREIAFDVMMRVRTSTGIRPTGFYGSFLMQNTTDIEMSAMDADKAVQVEIKYDDNVSGQRRLRIHNISLPVTQDFNQIYRLTDEDAIITHLFKAGEKLVRDKSPKDMRDDIVNTCAHILSTYREKCSETAPLGQLILPECLKLLPVHVNCVMKNDALNGGSELTVDDRSWMMNLVPAMTIQEVSAFLYPRVYAISGLSLDSNGSFLQLPSQVRSSIDYLSNDEAYLIENGFVAFIWLGLSVSSEWLHNVFNVNSLAQLDAEKHELPERDNPSSRAVRHLLNTVNEGRSRHAKVFIIKQSEGLESWMKNSWWRTDMQQIQYPM